MQPTISTIMIQDTDLISRIQEEQARRGDGSTARTAKKLLEQRLTQLEEQRRGDANAPSSADEVSTVPEE